jgi:hypothetical protein
MMPVESHARADQTARDATRGVTFTAGHCGNDPAEQKKVCFSAVSRHPSPIRPQRINGE